MKVHHASVTLHGDERIEITDVTKLVRAAVHESGIRCGLAIANALHTTCALFVNEFQAALVEDLKALVTRLVPSAAGYRHDDPRFSDCERGNAEAHLATALLGRSIALGVNDGDLVLGRFQSIILAELDGPRSRAIAIQVIGE
jgi:secondary thiamine-phosphate synthase enzyme